MKKGTIRIFTDINGELRWALDARNGRTIADSAESYKRRAAMNNALRYQSEYHKVIDDSGKQRETFPTLGVYLNQR